MFSIQNKIENDFDKIILKDETNGTIAEIIPSCGGILYAFATLKNGEVFNVIESYDSAEDFKKNVTGKGFLGAKLSPFVCRLHKGTYQFKEKNYVIEKYYAGENALHGILYDVAFTVIEQEADSEGAKISMKYEYRKTDKGYPFNYDCIIVYKLEKNNKLTIDTEVINKDEVEIPIQDGWHPYFKLDSKINELELQFRSYDMVEFDKDLIPTGKLIPYKEFDTPKAIGNTFLDNCFTLNFTEGQPICLLLNAEKNIQVEIHTDESYPCLQLYTPPHRKSIAIENLSSAPDAFNNELGFKILARGESATFRTAYKISPLHPDSNRDPHTDGLLSHNGAL
jgi:aldose 1-epimerase